MTAGPVVPTNDAVREPNGPVVVVLGFTVPEDVAAALDVASAIPASQTHNFARSLVSALRQGGCKISLLSTHPVPNFPAYPQRVFRGGSFVAHGVPGRYLPFLNLPVLKHVSRLASALGVGVPFLRRHGARHVIVHGVHLPFLIVGALLKIWRKVNVIVVLTDPAGVVSPQDGGVTRALKWVDAKLARTMLKGVDGVVVLSEALATDLAPGRPRLLIEGIVDERVIVHGRVARSQSSRRDETFRIAYAGGLSRDYGVDRLVHAVELLDRDDVQLDVFGAGELSGWLRNLNYPWLNYHGQVGHEALLGLLVEEDLLVNPRPVSADFVRYSFPSKILEYMALGVPVLTTPLPNLPSDYEGRLLISADDSIEALSSAIREAVEAGSSELGVLGARGRSFMLETRSTAVQGQRLAAFMRDLKNSTS